MLRRCALALIVLTRVPAWAAEPREAPPFEAPTFEGPDHSEIDILRPAAGYPRIFVQAELPDGSVGLFLVDTGADVSVLRPSTVERLGLEVEERWSVLQGLSGSHEVGLAVADLRIGEMHVPDVEFAVGVRGVSETAGFMPLDGILGNNVWSRFVLEIDYPADLLVLHRPGTVKVRGRPDVLFFDGKHVHSPLTVVSDSDPPITSTFLAQIDTGAGQLTLCAGTGAAFRHTFTEGLEELRGLGASETLPPYRFLEITRRVPVDKVVLGGRRYALDTSARWLAFHDLATESCDNGLRALVGHEYLAGHRVFFDYQGARFSLTKSRRKPRQVNGHGIMLRDDLRRYGHADERALLRAKLLIGAGNLDEAQAQLEALVASPADEQQEAEARVLLARLQRHLGHLDAAWEALKPLSAGALVDEEEIVGTVNGLLFERREAEALDLARRAVEARPDVGWAHVALADVQLFRGDVEGAGTSLHRAAELEGFPDAHLLRRARVALAADDRYGAMAHVRKLLQLYPFGGEFLWFYALLLEGDQDAGTFRHDMDLAMARLHPDRRPVDFQVAALQALGDHDAALALMREGMERHCEALASAARANCRAWFRALAGHQLDDALADIERALEAEGPRSDFLDTKAMVHLARGELAQAHEAAWAAARLSPDDVYMLWQAERIGDRLRAAPDARGDARPAVADHGAP